MERTRAEEERQMSSKHRQLNEAERTDAAAERRVAQKERNYMAVERQASHHAREQMAALLSEVQEERQLLEKDRAGKLACVNSVPFQR